VNVLVLSRGDSMEWNHLNPPDLPDWSSCFSQVVSVEWQGVKQVFVSGQVGVDAQKRLAGDGGFEAQTEQAFANLGTALARAKAGWQDVALLTIYVVAYTNGTSLTARVGP
jgi:enamine deaminase RidA (YjgF/YER057c/UK114 family)